MVSFHPRLLTFVFTNKVLVHVAVTLTGLLGVWGCLRSFTFSLTGNIGRSLTSPLVHPCLVFGASSVEQGLGMCRLLTQEFCDWCVNDSSLGTELWQQCLVTP